MKNSTYNYLVIEDDTNIWSNIEHRMNKFTNWKPIGFSAELQEAIDYITKDLPELIFTDWSIKNGDAFDILDYISQLENYNPYVIFFTGYQSDHPEIPENIVNKYSVVRKYIVKPIHENLTEHLHEYIEEAENLIQISEPKQYIWIEDAYRRKHRIATQDWIAIVQSEISSRYKSLYTKTSEEIVLKYTWKKCIKFLEKNNIPYTISHHRKSIINKAEIIRVSKPFVWLTNEIKIEVSREQWSELEAFDYINA